MMFEQYWICPEAAGCPMCQKWRADLLAWLKARAEVWARYTL